MRTGTRDGVRLWMVAAGFAIVVGFFLPLIQYHGLKLISGWEIFWHGGAPVLDRFLIALVPIAGVGLAITALAGTTSAKWFSLAAGLLIVVYPMYKLIAALVQIAGPGAFLILGGGLTALVCGIVAPRR